MDPEFDIGGSPSGDPWLEVIGSGGIDDELPGGAKTFESGDPETLPVLSPMIGRESPDNPVFLLMSPLVERGRKYSNPLSALLALAIDRLSSGTYLLSSLSGKGELVKAPFSSGKLPPTGSGKPSGSDAAVPPPSEGEAEGVRRLGRESELSFRVRGSGTPGNSELSDPAPTSAERAEVGLLSPEGRALP